MKRNYSDWFIELGALGRLDPDEQAEFDRRRRQDPDLQKRLAALERSNHEILARYPWPVETARQPALHDRPRRSRFPFRPRWALTGLATLCLFGIALSMISILSHSGGRSVPPMIREKGKAATDFSYGLRIYRKVSGKVEKLREGETVRSGDWMQIAYRLPAVHYAYILSLDGSGRATCHWPLETTAPERVPAGKWLNLPDGLILDDAPEYERFFLLTSDRPIAADRIVREIETWVRTRARIGDDLPVLPGLVFRSAVNLRKAR